MFYKVGRCLHASYEEHKIEAMSNKILYSQKEYKIFRNVSVEQSLFLFVIILSLLVEYKNCYKHKRHHICVVFYIDIGSL